MTPWDCDFKSQKFRKPINARLKEAQKTKIHSIHSKSTPEWILNIVGVEWSEWVDTKNIRWASGVEWIHSAHAPLHSAQNPLHRSAKLEPWFRSTIVTHSTLMNHLMMESTHSQMNQPQKHLNRPRKIHPGGFGPLLVLESALFYVGLLIESTYLSFLVGVSIYACQKNASPPAPTQYLPGQIIGQESTVTKDPPAQNSFPNGTSVVTTTEQQQTMQQVSITQQSA